MVDLPPQVPQAIIEFLYQKNCDKTESIKNTYYIGTWRENKIYCYNHPNSQGITWGGSMYILDNGTEIRLSNGYENETISMFLVKFQREINQNNKSKKIVPFISFCNEQHR